MGSTETSFTRPPNPCGLDTHIEDERIKMQVALLHAHKQLFVCKSSVSFANLCDSRLRFLVSQLSESPKK
jgi:hypothetical protein